MEFKAESGLEKLLASRKFVCTAELRPPKHYLPNRMLDIARSIKNSTDAFNLTDNQNAVVRLSSLASGILIKGMGLEPIIQVTCRDRNRIGIQSDLLGAASFGLKNVLCITGDHQRLGNHPHSKNVFDLDSIQLILLVDQLRKGRFQCGEQLRGVEPPEFFIGCAANPFADPFAYRVVRLEKKINAGADFVQTRSVLDMERFERFMEMVRERGLDERAYILAGLTPVMSAETARYLQKYKAGMTVSEDICQRLEKAEDCKEEAINIVVEQIKYIRENIKGVSGIHLMADGWEETIPVIIERAGLSPRPIIS